MIRRLINFNPGKLFEQFLSGAYPTVYKINIRNSIIRLDLGFSRWPDLRDGSAWQSLRKLPWLSFLRNERYKSRLRDSDTRDISVTECMEKRKKRGEREREGKGTGRKERRIRDAMATYQNPIFVASLNDDTKYSMPTA